MRVNSSKAASFVARNRKNGTVSNRSTIRKTIYFRHPEKRRRSAVQDLQPRFETQRVVGDSKQFVLHFWNDGF